MTAYEPPDEPTLRRLVSMMLAYVMLGLAGILTLLVTPSAALAREGGQTLVIIWGTLCLIGGFLGLTGLFLRKTLIELIGGGLAATVSLTWTASLVLQAISTWSPVALPAACVAGALTLLLVQRQVDAWRPRR